MPWRDKHDLTSFNPETVGLLAEALDEAFDQLKRSGELSNRNEDVCRSALASYIIGNAKTGQLDKAELIGDALFRFRL
jgi:hypothetical protein